MGAVPEVLDQLESAPIDGLAAAAGGVVNVVVRIVGGEVLLGYVDPHASRLASGVVTVRAEIFAGCESAVSA